MFKNSINFAGKPADATYVAHAALVRGMGVIKSYADSAKKTAFVASDTDANIFIVDRDDYATGIDCTYIDRPETEYDNIAIGEFVLLRTAEKGEQFLTNQYDATAIASATAYTTMLCVNSAGKFDTGAGTYTKYLFAGTKVEGGVTYIIVDVID